MATPSPGKGKEIKLHHMYSFYAKVAQINFVGIRT